MKKKDPIKVVETIIEISEMSSKTFLPSLSTTNVDSKVEPALIDPKIIVEESGEIEASAA